MKHTEVFNRWYSERMGHPLGVQLGKSAVDELKEENAELREALELMTDFAEGQMHPEQNDPSMFDDEDFGNLKHAKKLLNK